MLRATNNAVQSGRMMKPTKKKKKSNKKKWLLVLVALVIVGLPLSYLGGREVLKMRIRGWREQGIAASKAEQHAAAADPDALGAGRKMRDQDLRRAAGKPRGSVMLGQPETGVTQSLGRLCERDASADGVGGGLAVQDRTLVEKAQAIRHDSARAQKARRPTEGSDCCGDSGDSKRPSR
jgi:hypothetical protein